MNFDFAEEMNLLRQQASRMLAAQCTPTVVRKALDESGGFDRKLWNAVAQMGWAGAAVPERFGGSGLGYEGLCVLAEELGRVLAPVPFASSVYLATEAVLSCGSEVQKEAWLPRLAGGDIVGTFALAEGLGNPRPQAVRARVSGGRLSGEKWPVSDGEQADVVIVAAVDDAGAPALYLVETTAGGVTRGTLQMIDPSRPQAKLVFDCAPAERLGGECGWAAIGRLLDKAAVLMAFEQVGGASACLEMATAYAKERVAFGRPIGSFQAIKHKLADIYISTELARSNAYYGAWALSTDAPELALAAAAARVSATEAFRHAARENIQTHGGMGFTWELDCHLYYRRASTLAMQLGSVSYWKERVVTHWTDSAIE
ncbi:acyl-CoA dehydrogenase family protein [Cupriavidus alkaliphilus]|uniref:acyl-CoA dehydrogenase family protein n=1 Tax=Cupriavidus alkaliphilus TaxID=942866 RepID=UPI00161E7E6C|nr:acyl-CoA dehydrogenase family protein [Cupriavidus alkaliphilus]MBB2919341.1 alkylation response protein AidB-like acyl-CoA dehydrogenase [Cupriavidus alkaliphilus]